MMPIARMLSVCSLTMALTVTICAGQEPTPLVPDAHTLLLVHFDSPEDVANPAYIKAGHGTLSGKSGETVSFVQGKFDKGLALSGKGQVSFPCTGGNFPTEVGSAEMWIKPTKAWKGWETPFQRGGTAWDEYGQNMMDVHVDQVDKALALVMNISGQGGSLKVAAKLGDWPADQWRHVTLCWDLPKGKGAIYFDGKLAGEATAKPFTLPPGVGGMRLNGRDSQPMSAVVDELRISDIWRYPGSEGYQGEAVPAQAADRALNDDPSFEICTLGTLGNPQPAWNKGEGVKEAAWELVSTNPHTGQRCLKVTQPALGQGKAIVSTRDWWIPASAGLTYSLTVWLRTDTPGVEARLVLGADQWYCKQLVVRPTAEWKAYTLAWTLADKQGSLLVGRIENWGKGTLYIDDAAVTEGGKDQPSETITVDAGVDRGPWAPVYDGVDTAIICWSSAVFDQEVVDTMKAAGIKRVRYTLLCPGVGPASKAKDQWDWTTIDRHFSMFKAAGITPLLTFSATPVWMSRDGTIDTPPKDFAQWGQMVSEAVRYLNVEKQYGIEYFEVWNEPDLPFWKGGTAEEFCKLYDVFVKAVRSVDPKAKVGGPGTSGSGCDAGQVYRGAAQFKYLKTFINYCGQNNLPLDFLSFHRYELDPGQIKFSCEEVRAWLQEYPALREAELIISEWNIAPGQDKAGRMDRSFNASYASAWMASAIDGGLGLATFFNFSDAAWSGPGKLFQQETGMVAPDSTPKPVYNAFRLWSMLDKTRLLTTGGSASTGAFATRGDNSVSVLVFNHGKPTTRTVKIENLPFTAANVQVERYAVDDAHANAFVLWERAKSPAKLPMPAFAQGAWSQSVNAKDLKGEGWKSEGAGYRAAAPAGSNDKVLTATKPGSTVEWAVEAPKAGQYSLWIKADCTYNGGVFEVAVDGKSLGQFDTFIGGLDMRWFTIPALQLSAGKHAITLTLTDAISKKLGWASPRRVLALDMMVLTDDPAFAPKPLAGGYEAQGGLNLKVPAALKAQTSTVLGSKEISLPLDLADHGVLLLRLTPAK